MPSVTTQAIVLRYAPYRENDKMLTLLTPGSGCVDALCRGCRRTTSPLLAASECLTMGEYVLYTAGGRSTVTSCQVSESFYPLRERYERLEEAFYMTKLCGEAAPPGQKCVELFTLLARSLFRLAYTDRPLDTVVAGFLLHFSAINGSAPVLERCARCGGELKSEPRLFDAENGGVLCGACSSSLIPALPLHAGQREWMIRVLQIGIDKWEKADEDPPTMLLRKYVQTRMLKER